MGIEVIGKVARALAEREHGLVARSPAVLRAGERTQRQAAVRAYKAALGLVGVR